MFSSSLIYHLVAFVILFSFGQAAFSETPSCILSSSSCAVTLSCPSTEKDNCHFELEVLHVVGETGSRWHSDNSTFSISFPPGTNRIVSPGNGALWYLQIRSSFMETFHETLFDMTEKMFIDAIKNTGLFYSSVEKRQMGNMSLNFSVSGFRMLFPIINSKNGESLFRVTKLSILWENPIRDLPGGGFSVRTDGFSDDVIGLGSFSISSGITEVSIAITFEIYDNSLIDSRQPHQEWPSVVHTSEFSISPFSLPRVLSSFDSSQRIINDINKHAHVQKRMPKLVSILIADFFYSPSSLGDAISSTIATAIVWFVIAFCFLLLWVVPFLLILPRFRRIFRFAFSNESVDVLFRTRAIGELWRRRLGDISTLLQASVTMLPGVKGILYSNSFEADASISDQEIRDRVDMMVQKSNHGDETQKHRVVPSLDLKTARSCSSFVEALTGESRRKHPTDRSPTVSSRSLMQKLETSTQSSLQSVYCGNSSSPITEDTVSNEFILADSPSLCSSTAVSPTTGSILHIETREPEFSEENESYSPDETLEGVTPTMLFMRTVTSTLESKNGVISGRIKGQKESRIHFTPRGFAGKSAWEKDQSLSIFSDELDRLPLAFSMKFEQVRDSQTECGDDSMDLSGTDEDYCDSDGCYSPPRPLFCPTMSILEEEEEEISLISTEISTSRERTTSWNPILVDSEATLIESGDDDDIIIEVAEGLLNRHSSFARDSKSSDPDEISLCSSSPLFRSTSPLFRSNSPQKCSIPPTYSDSPVVNSQLKTASTSDDIIGIIRACRSNTPLLSSPLTQFLEGKRDASIKSKYAKEDILRLPEALASTGKLSFNVLEPPGAFRYNAVAESIQRDFFPILREAPVCAPNPTLQLSTDTLLVVDASGPSFFFYDSVVGMTTIRHNREFIGILGAGYSASRLLDPVETTVLHLIPDTTPFYRNRDNIEPCDFNEEIVIYPDEIILSSRIWCDPMFGIVPSQVTWPSQPLETSTVPVTTKRWVDLILAAKVPGVRELCDDMDSETVESHIYDSFGLSSNIHEMRLSPVVFRDRQSTPIASVPVGRVFRQRNLANTEIQYQMAA